MFYDDVVRKTAGQEKLTINSSFIDLTISRWCKIIAKVNSHKCNVVRKVDVQITKKKIKHHFIDLVSTESGWFNRWNYLRKRINFNVCVCSFLFFLDISIYWYTPFLWFLPTINNLIMEHKIISFINKKKLNEIDSVGWLVGQPVNCFKSYSYLDLSDYLLKIMATISNNEH